MAYGTCNYNAVFGWLTNTILKLKTESSLKAWDKTGPASTSRVMKWVGNCHVVEEERTTNGGNHHGGGEKPMEQSLFWSKSTIWTASKKLAGMEKK